jgi:hypothetical protein
MSSAGSYQNGSIDISTREEPQAYERFQTHQHQRRIQARKRRLFFFSIIFCLIGMIALAIHVVFQHAARIHRLQHITPKGQMKWLNGITMTKKHVPSPGCTSTIILMRHCEKTETPNSNDDVVDVEGDHHCSEIGYQRADYVPTLFGPDGRWPTPSYLYAMSSTRPGVNHETFRQVETLEPLSKQTHLPINSHFTVGSSPYFADYYFDRLASGKLCNTVTVISWKHSDIPNMAQALGCGPDEGCPSKYPHDNFDQVWVIQHEYETMLLKEQGRLLKQQQHKSGAWTVKGSVTKMGFSPNL